MRKHLSHPKLNVTIVAGKRNCKKKKKDKDTQDKGKQNKQAKKAEDTETKSENQKQEKSEHAWMARIQESNVKVKWILDSGASQHMTNMKDWFEKYTILENPIIIETASSTITAIGRGNIRMKTFVNGEERLCVMHNVLHVPNIRDNLLSISNLQKRKFNVHFKGDDETAEISKNGVLQGIAVGNRPKCASVRCFQVLFY